jgi:glutathione synthase/RimK-type ligase-like ATP-grasp enzyme
VHPEVVAIASCRESPDAEADRLYPDADAPLLVRALAAVGLEGRPVAWDDPTVDWSSFHTVVVRSTWDSVDRPTEFLAWCAGVPRLQNPPDAIAWNLDKRYLVELERAGIPTIPTTWLAPGDAFATPDVDFVVKPAVSAGARGTAHHPGGDRRAEEHVRALHDAGQTVLVQPHVEAFATVGEVKQVFIGGEPSHAIRSTPVLTRGAAVSERPWERLPAPELTSPSPAEAELARDTLDVIGRDLLYARVDSVDGMVVEVELIDPSLSLLLAPDAAARLAAAIRDLPRV